jgi:3-oxoadipate enol-lactonase
MPFAGEGNRLTYYAEAGSGFPLVLIHGVGLDHTMWERQVDELSRHYRVILYDMLGHGRSARPPGPYTLAQFADQLQMLIDRLDIAKAHILGFSMGGLVAEAFALKAPNRLSALVIANSVAKRTPEQRNGVLSRVEEVREKGHTATIDAALERWFTAAFRKDRADVVEAVRRRLEENDPAAYLAAYTVFANADAELFDELPQIACPTLIVTGEKDSGSTPEMARMLGRQIKDSSVVILMGGKHMMPVERAAEFNRILLSFLKKHG